jgi:endo-1,4-beta-xylanase
MTLAKTFEGDFLVGAALGGRTLLGQDALSTPLLGQFNAFTAENAMKPDAIQPREATFRFEQADRLVEIARKHKAAAIGHALVWHSQTPGWFFEGSDGKPASRELALRRMRKHIAVLVGRYKGKITQWDVVNEAISDSGGDMLRPSPWRTAIGDDYIAEAFRAAHAADPHATLIYNDYNIENPGKRQKALRLLRSLRDQGVPVHAVGIQGHWALDYPDLATIESALIDFAGLGLKVMITELDLSVLPTRYRGADVGVRQEGEAGLDPYVAGLPEVVARRQAERYRALFALLRRHRDVVDRVTFWGVHDGQSWKNNFPIRGRTDYPLLFDRQGKPKPAFDALLSLGGKGAVRSGGPTGGVRAMRTRVAGDAATQPPGFRFHARPRAPARP